MNKRVHFVSVAALELELALAWYDERLDGLGDEFLGSVEVAVNAISQNPEAYQLVHENVRRVLTRRFPYALFFVEQTDRLVVLAVFHVSRDPQEWKGRA